MSEGTKRIVTNALATEEEGTEVKRRIISSLQAKEVKDAPAPRALTEDEIKDGALCVREDGVVLYRADKPDPTPGQEWHNNSGRRRR